MPVMTSPLDEHAPSSQAPPQAERPAAPQRPKVVRLGEELPIFCERCGYSLHGLPQARCQRCEILHFHCPECGHHQPINTLRPAAQRIIGRVRAFALGFWMLFKLNYFGWLLVGWGAMGMAWSYDSQWISAPVRPGGRGGGGTMHYVPRVLDIDSFMAFAMFAVIFGTVSRMFLLRWRRGVLVGAVLGAVAGAAVMIGAWLRSFEVTRWTHTVPSPFTLDLLILVVWAAGIIALGAVIVWPIWLSLVHLFLPKRTAQSLIDWQNSLSQPVSRDPSSRLATQG